LGDGVRCRRILLWRQAPRWLPAAAIFWTFAVWAVPIVEPLDALVPSRRDRRRARPADRTRTRTSNDNQSAPHLAGGDLLGIDGSVARVHGMCVHPGGQSASRPGPMIIIREVR